MPRRKRKPRPRPQRPIAVSRPGAPPGTLLAPPGAHETTIRIIDYIGDELVEREAVTVADLRAHVESKSVSWIDVTGLANAELIGELGSLLGVSRLVLEDVINVGQRSKLENHETFACFISRLVRPGEHLELEQLSLLFGEGFVVTFQERPGDCFEPVRDRLRQGRKRIRGLGCDYLAYALIDALIDSYFPVVDGYRERLEDIEDQIAEGSDTDVMQRIHEIKRDLRALRRFVWPTTEAVHKLLDPELALVTNETREYLADCWDHARRMQDSIESNRELSTDLVDMHLSRLSHRMNEVMQVLTIFAAIFIPLTFVAGIYGMNFDPAVSPWNMPELGWVYGYPAALTLMGVMGVTLFLGFVRKGWIGGRKGDR